MLAAVDQQRLDTRGAEIQPEIHRLLPAGGRSRLPVVPNGAFDGTPCRLNSRYRPAGHEFFRVSE